jgi:hypothetical protein
VLSRLNGSQLAAIATNTDLYRERLGEFREADDQLRGALACSNVAL